MNLFPPHAADGWLGRYSLHCFFALAFTFTWANWIPRALASRGIVEITVPGYVPFLAGYGPALAAIIVISATGGADGLRALVQRLCRWRVGFRWYAIALFLPAAQAFTALGLHLLFGGEWQAHEEPVSHEVGAILSQALLLGLMFTLGFDGLGEELGWRGFALPQLLARLAPLPASVLLGALWALWHLPYALTIGSAMADKPFHLHLSTMIAQSIMFTWLFKHARGSILLAILFHASGNVTVNVLPRLVPGVYDSGAWGEIVRWSLVGAVLTFKGLAGPKEIRASSQTTSSFRGVG